MARRGDALDRTPLRLLPPRLRFEIVRKAFHVLAAIVAVPVLLVLPLAWAVGLAVFAVVVIVVAEMVLQRRLPPFEPVQTLLLGPIARALAETRRADERFPWSPVLFLGALVAVALGTAWLDLPLAYAFAAFGILGLGDAASALIGIAYGKRRLPWNTRKTWAGAVAGLAGGVAAAVVFAAVDYAWRGVVFPIEFLPIAFAGAALGALLETLPGVQDNLAVPVGAWAIMAALGLALGVV